MNTMTTTQTTGPKATSASTTSDPKATSASTATDSTSARPKITGEERRPLTEQELSHIKERPGAHIHLMGICGTAMASLAGLLKNRGYHITGSDQNVYPPMSTQLENLGIKIMPGYRKENLAIGTPNEPDLVIVGNVISRKYEEAQALLESKIPFTSLPQAMGSLVIEKRHSIVIAGTHGKTTTSSLNALIADGLGLKPGFLIGGIPKNFGQSFRDPKGDWFIIEGDEYDTAFFDKVPKFIYYRPQTVVLNAVEFDHADIYRDLEHVKDAFLKLLDLIPANGCLIACADDENIQDLLGRRKNELERKNIRIITFGIQAGNYRASGIQPHPVAIEGLAEEASRLGMRFTLNRSQRGESAASNTHTTSTGAAVSTNTDTNTTTNDAGSTNNSGESTRNSTGPIDIPMVGEYNIKNTLAAIALWESLGFATKDIIREIKKFRGVKRRQEVLGSPHGVTIIEDFAHHPTAVRETIKTIQTQYPKAQVFSVFEARSATSRRNIFQEEYAQAFIEAKTQHLLMPPPFHLDALPVGERFDMELLLTTLRQANVDIKVLENVDLIVQNIKERAKPGDVVLVMSNGGFDGIYQKLLSTL